MSWPSGLAHWTQVLVLSECGFESRPGQLRCLCPWPRHLTIIALSFGWSRVLCNTRKRTQDTNYREREGGLPRCFWIRALSTQQGGYMRATNIMYYYYYYLNFPTFQLCSRAILLFLWNRIDHRMIQKPSFMLKHPNTQTKLDRPTNSG